MASLPDKAELLYSNGSGKIKNPMEGTMPPTSEAGMRGQAVRRYGPIVLIFVLLFDMFRVGIVRDLHDVIGPQGWGRGAFAIGAAITELAHGGYGHTISNVVEEVLTANGLTDHAPTLTALSTKFPDNLRNAHMMDNAIKKAVAFTGPAATVRGSSGDDLGFVDYAKLGFILFGYQLIALYLLFFLIQAASAAVFAIVFRDRSTALCALLVIVVAEWVVFRSVLLDESNMGSIADPRFLSILAIIPGLHLAFVLWEGLRATTWQVVAVVFQSGIVALVVLIRASAIWVPFGLMVFGLAWLVATRNGAPFLSRLRRLWTLAILLLCMVLQQAWVSATLHPVYREKNAISHHVLWHSLFYALAVANPNWETKYAAQFDHARFDEVPPTAAKKYLLRHPPSNPDGVYLTPDRKHLTFQAAETYARKAFIEFLLADPGFVAATFLYYNPRKFLRSLVVLAGPSLRSTTVLAGAALVIVVMGSMLASHPDASRRFSAATALLVAALAVSSAPVVLTAPGLLTVTDPLVLSIGAVLALAICCAAFVLRRLHHAIAGRVFGAAHAASTAGAKDLPAGGPHK